MGVQVGQVGVFYEANISQPPLLFSNIETSSLNVEYVPLILFPRLMQILMSKIQR